MHKFILLTILFSCGFAYGQDIKIDKLEMYFDQGHYKMVHRRANRLLDNPEYDNSLEPAYYRALSTLMLYQNENWQKRHKKSLDQSIQFFLNLKKTTKGLELMDRHIYELISLEKDMRGWAADLKRQKKETEFNKVNGLVNGFFGKKEFDKNEEEKLEEQNKELEEELKPTKEIVTTDKRKVVIEGAREQLGVPYAWAGNSPKGFDCSGFTCFVYKDIGITLPRRASDQKKGAEKVKKRNVEVGDLVFFKKGSKINHVGIVISMNDGSIQMIHASTSIGISIVDIYNSKYWSSRIDSFGRYIKN